MARFPGVYTSPYGNSIAALLARQGEIAAQGALQSGAIWSQAINQLGQIGAGAVEQHQQRKDQKKREAMFDQALSSYDPAQPEAFYRAAVVAFGPELATQTLRALTEAEAQKPEMAEGKAADPKKFAEKMRWLQAMEKTAPGYIKERWPTIASVYAPDAKELYGVDLTPEYQDVYGQMIRAWRR